MTVTEEQAPGPVRINLLFNERAVRVPYGVTLFDAASWNGIAIDSTCGGHGTCKKCKIRVLDGSTPVSPLDARAFSAEELRAGWRLACRTLATRDTTIEVPPLTTRPKAATVGVGRQVILRPAVQKRYLELAEPDLADQASDLERVLAQLDDLEPKFTRHGYDVHNLAEQFNAKPAEIRRFLRGELDAARTRELTDEMLAAGLPI